VYDHVKAALDALWLRRHARTATFSQFGEDRMVLDRLGRDGLYLDIGSNHPYKANSTYFFMSMAGEAWRSSRSVRSVRSTAHCARETPA
jgi:hypothetical protein